MTTFIELHEFVSGDSMFVNTDKIILFTPHTSEEDGVPCSLISIGYQTGALQVKEPPAEILDKIRESEQKTDSGVVFAERLVKTIKRDLKSI